MDINDLTIGQAKELAKMFADNKQVYTPPHRLIGEKVIVRSRDAGVHFGTVSSKNGDEVYLTDSRRLWKWVCKKGDFVQGVAKYGITDESKVGCFTDQAILGVCEIIPCSQGAAISIENMSSHNE